MKRAQKIPLIAILVALLALWMTLLTANAEEEDARYLRQRLSIDLVYIEDTLMVATPDEAETCLLEVIEAQAGEISACVLLDDGSRAPLWLRFRDGNLFAELEEGELGEAQGCLQDLLIQELEACQASSALGLRLVPLADHDDAAEFFDWQLRRRGYTKPQK